MRIALTGATGFVGQRLIPRLLRDGHSLHALGRRPQRRFPSVGFYQWDASAGAAPVDALSTAEAIIHLAGEPVAQRWNDEVKQRIRNSRVKGTQQLVASLSKMQRRPHTLICASATGYYGDRGDEILDESSGPGSGFLADLCVEWEQAANAASSLGLRVVFLRIGIVLGKEGGALKQMLLPFRLGLGGPIGSGKQWLSWIQLDDLVESIVFALNRDDLSGPVNATAPNPVRNLEFAKALGEALGRPAVIPTPMFALRVMLGEGAEAVLESERVLPKALERAGFGFRYPELPDALRQAIST